MKKKTNFRLSVCFPYSSFTTTVSELTRGSSTGAGSGKGHVKSASVSSPGPSAADNSTTGTQQSDSLGARYKSHSHTKPHIFMSITETCNRNEIRRTSTNWNWSSAFHNILLNFKFTFTDPFSHDNYYSLIFIFNLFENFTTNFERSGHWSIAAPKFLPRKYDCTPAFPKQLTILFYTN